MIVEFLLRAVIDTLNVIFSALPQLPSMPSWVSEYTTDFIALLIAPIQILAYILTPTILIFVLTSALVIFNFEIAYKSIMWVVRKLPVSSH